jgi:Carboxypeptidase regulatory-like domain
MITHVSAMEDGHETGTIRIIAVKCEVLNVRRRWIFVASSVGIGLVTALNAQTTDSNPGHAPSVFLGNGPKSKKDKVPTARALKGTVMDDTGKPLGGALVTLTDTKSNQKRTFITKDDGRYNFDELSFTIDYQLVAKYKELQSEPRKISQYDHRPDIVRILTVSQSAQAQ